jgi:ribosomal protein L29
MSVTLDKFILQLAEKAGIDAADKRLAEVFAHTEINRINVNQELVNDFGSNLISVTDATNNHPKIKTHYFAEVMSNVDRTLEAIYRQYEFTEDEIKELNKERSSTKRISLVAEKMKEKLSTAQAATGDAKDKDKDIAALKTTITELNNQLATEKENVKKAKSKFEDQLSGFKLNHSLEQKLIAQKTVFDTMPSPAKVAALKTLIDKELQDNKVEWYLDENGSLALRLKEGGANYFDKANKQVTADAFISGILANSKVLQQSNGAGAGNNGQQAAAAGAGATNNGSGQPSGTGQQAQGNSAMKALIEESQKDLLTQNPMDIVTGSNS